MNVRKILIIDDEKLIRTTTAMLFQQHRITAVSAASGEEGIRKAEAELPDVILLDIMMPGMDGLDTVRLLRENEKTRRIPVILFTAGEFTPDGDPEIMLTVSALVHKPFHLKELLRIIDNIGKDDRHD